MSYQKPKSYNYLKVIYVIADFIFVSLVVGFTFLSYTLKAEVPTNIIIGDVIFTLSFALITIIILGIFKNYRIIVDGDFTNEYNEICLEAGKGRRFPIAWAETEGEAVAAINVYVAGLTHGKENSYPRVCDRDNY